MINIYNAQRFCKDDISLIENYDKAIADNTQMWDCHHKLELTLDGEFAHTADELIRLNMYFNRPYFELIFLTHADHTRLHKPMKGRHCSEQHKQRISNSNKGKHHTEEARRKMSEAKLGKTRNHHSEETKRKISEAHKGKHMSDETRRKISESLKSKHSSEETKRKISEY